MALCELKVTGKTTGTVVVANSLIAGKVTRLVSFNTIKQIEGALARERTGIIKIVGTLPEHVQEKLSQEGQDRFANQTFGVETNAAISYEAAAMAKLPAPSVEKEEPQIEDPQLGHFPDPSVEKEEEVIIAEEDKGAPQLPTPSVENDEGDDVSPASPGLMRSEIIEMTAAQLKTHIKANNLDIKGVSGMNAKKLTNAVLTNYGLDTMTSEEEAQD